MKNAWYDCSPCEQMTIRRYKKLSDTTPEKSVVVTDVASIASVIGLLDKLPTSGDLFVSFSTETEHLEIILTGGGKTSLVEFYGRLLKTSATSIMNSGVAENDALYKLALSLLK